MLILYAAFCLSAVYRTQHCAEHNMISSFFYTPCGNMYMCCAVVLSTLTSTLRTVSVSRRWNLRSSWIAPVQFEINNLLKWHILFAVGLPPCPTPPDRVFNHILIALTYLFCRAADQLAPAGAVTFEHFPEARAGSVADLRRHTDKHPAQISPPTVCTQTQLGVECVCVASLQIISLCLHVHLQCWMLSCVVCVYVCSGGGDGRVIGVPYLPGGVEEVIA